MEDKNFSFKIEDEDLAYKRLDLFLVSALKKLDEVVSRQQIKNLFKQEMMYAKDCKLELKKMPRTGTIVEVIIPAPRAAKAIAEDLPLDIMFEEAVKNKTEVLEIEDKQGGFIKKCFREVKMNPSDLLKKVEDKVDNMKWKAK